MIFAQTPLAWPEILNHSVAIGVLLFIGTLVFMWYKRTYGNDGTATKESANRIECDKEESLTRIACAKKVSETLAASQVTLVELKNVMVAQQSSCDKHANAVTHICAVEESLLHSFDREVIIATEDRKKILKQVDEHTGYHENMHETWGKVNPMEFRVPPVLDAILHIIDTAEELAPKGDTDCIEKLRELRKNVKGVKDKMKTD